MGFDLNTFTADILALRARAQALANEMLGEIPDGTTWKGSDQDIELRNILALLVDAASVARKARETVQTIGD